VLYVKSRSLYGIAFAKKAIVEKGLCCLVEGYTDVISLHQAGITNVVASSGTSLTVDQVRLIKRYAPAVTILYDGDPAGIKASLRGIDIILAEGLSVKVVLFPDGDDPDSFARKHSSAEIAAYITDSAKDFLVFKADLLVKR
jgi:DNA primase